MMVEVCAGTASGGTVGFRQVGIRLAVDVNLDASIIPAVLVPASVEMLGDRDWYFLR